ncbi:MAG: neutral/alkaline non-lysosomal ceramidase N-terminal domain-containing protein [Planctomycetes bacterium]|nr:neutral/alkaline non-lysosomal ceramidase N-terminal domain-containing protein [Planctomycetota bacterium]
MFQKPAAPRTCARAAARVLTHLLLAALLVAFLPPPRAARAGDPAAAPAAAAPATARSALRVGFGVADFTPDYPIPLGGYGNRLGKLSTGVHDPVRARAVVIANGERKIAWVILDLIGVIKSVRRDLLARVGTDLGLARENFILSATHDHSGPGGLTRQLHWQIAMGPFDPALYALVLARAEAAVRAADADLAPARLGIGVGSVPHLNRNRRIHGGPIDPQLAVLRVDRPDGTPRGILVNYAAHPTILGGENMRISADFPGALCDALEARLGPGGHALFAQADEGDQSPRAPDAPDDFARVKAYGELLAAEAWKVAQATPTADTAFLKGALAEVELPRTPKSIIMPRTTLLQTVQIQDSVLAMIPGEMCVGLGLPLRAQLAARGPAHVLLVGLANDHLGYFTSPEMSRTGGYEADMNFFGPEIGATFARAFAKLLVYEEPWGM